jgi:DNA helicase-2/ATP-dependent DNA helicase PcrA
MSVSANDIARRFDNALARGLRHAWGDPLGCGGDRIPLHRQVYDITQCAKELNTLVSGEDLCYDRPGSAIAYAAWYHGERVNQFIRVLESVPELVERARPWRVIDLGAGSGAVGWAIVARELMSSRSRAGRPPIRLELIESSRPMLRLAMLLWRSLEEEFQAEGVSSIVSIAPGSGWRHESWPRMTTAVEEADLLTAHYLFDYSEIDPQKLSESVALFRKQLRHQRVSRLLCCTTTKKQAVLNRLRQDLVADHWSVALREIPVGPLVGSLPKTGEFRRVTLSAAISDDRLRRLSGREPSFSGIAKGGAVLLSASGSSLFQDLGNVSDLLTSEQERALGERGQNVAIKGSAGSGKTLVIALRMARFIRNAASSHQEHAALFTSFNRNLVKKVQEDVVELLRSDYPEGRIQVLAPSGDKSVLRWIEVNGRRLACFSTLDSVVSQMFILVGHEGDGSADSVVEILRDVLREPGIAPLLSMLPIQACPPARGDEEAVGGRSLERAARYLADEFRTVFYGRAGCDVEAYVDRKRVSRVRRKVRLSSTQRLAVGGILVKVRQTFFLRRCAAARGEPKAFFSALMVDEAQDLCDLDFSILRRLLRPGGSFTIAFDTSQAIRTGATFRPPRVEPDWKVHRLTGSYRMPLRVCEALVPVVEAIRAEEHEIGLEERLMSSPPVPSRLSVLGSRPFVVATRTEDEFAGIVVALAMAFDPPVRGKAPYDLVVLEKDGKLSRSIKKRLASESSNLTVSSMTSSVLTEKGIEFPWIIWSTRAECDEPLDLHRLCYTIVSRCTRHMVIWLQLDESCRPDVSLAPVMAGKRGLRRERLIAIDQVAEDALRYLDGCQDLGSHGRATI